MKVIIIDYGAGNVFSVQQAFRRLGLETVVTADSEVIMAADRIVLPGVGHAKPAMEQLAFNGLDRLIPVLKQPFLGICLGMQLLCNETEEGDTKGLGIFDTTVRCFDDTVIVPHMGWNDVTFANRETEAYYFVHGFKAGLCGHTVAMCDYGQHFSAILKKNNFLGVQFHPKRAEQQVNAY